MASDEAWAFVAQTPADLSIRTAALASLRCGASEATRHPTETNRSQKSESLSHIHGTPRQPL
jgi:hypothetical protein